MSANDSYNESNIGTCNFHCLQGNMRCSITSQLTLIGDIADKTKYHNGIDILFLTEPPLVTKTNMLQVIPDNIFTCYVEKLGYAALVTRNFTSWKCPQFCARNISVCQAKLNWPNLFCPTCVTKFTKKYLITRECMM